MILTPPGPRRPDRGRAIRIGIAGIATVVVASIAIFHKPGTTGGVGDSASGGATTTVTGVVPATSTTMAPLIVLDPSWQEKGVSRYSDSEESKALRDSLGPLVTTTRPPSTSSTVKGVATTAKGATTTVRGATTTIRPKPTAPPTTAPPPTAAPTVPPTLPSTTVAAAVAPAP